MDDDPRMSRFSAIYDAHRNRVWAFVVTQAGRQIADEVVNETFVVAWRRLADIPDPPLPWLLGVARNLLRANFRAHARHEAIVAELRSWTDPASQQAADIGETVAERLALLSALATLAAGDRELLVLTAWQGLTTQEAAKVTGSTPAAIRVRLHRARKRLKQALSAAGTPPWHTSAQQEPACLTAPREETS